jgi:hypothetical protein
LKCRLVMLRFESLSADCRWLIQSRLQFELLTTEIDLRASWARWNSLLQKPLFFGPPHRDYARHQLGLEIIFAVLFPQWTCNTARTEIYPQV